jgi:hypothetical protein
VPSLSLRVAREAVNALAMIVRCAKGQQSTDEYFPVPQGVVNTHEAGGGSQEFIPHSDPGYPDFIPIEETPSGDVGLG